MRLEGDSATREKVDATELARLLVAGGSVQAIAARFQCTPRTVRNTAKRHGLKIPSQRQRAAIAPRVPRAPRYPQLKATGWLQEQFAAGRTVRAVAAEVGCSNSTVRVTADRLGVVRRRALQRPLLRDPQWLREAYVDRGLSQEAIAREVGASDSAVSQALAHAGIPARRRVRHPRLDDAQWLRGVYIDENLSAPEIAARIGVHDNTVYEALARAGIRRRPARRRPDPRLDDVGWLGAQYVDAGRTAGSIAAELGWSLATVRGALRRHGLRRPLPARPSNQQLVDDWQRCRSVTALAEAYGATWTRTEVWLAEAGIFVARHPLLSRRRLHARLRHGDDITTMAKRFGVAPRRVYIELLRHHLADTVNST